MSSEEPAELAPSTSAADESRRARPLAEAVDRRGLLSPGLVSPPCRGSSPFRAAKMRPSGGAWAALPGFTGVGPAFGHGRAHDRRPFDLSTGTAGLVDAMSSFIAVVVQPQHQRPNRAASGLSTIRRAVAALRSLEAFESRSSAAHSVGVRWWWGRRRGRLGQRTVEGRPCRISRSIQLQVPVEPGGGRLLAALQAGPACS